MYSEISPLLSARSTGSAGSVLEMWCHILVRWCIGFFVLTGNQSTSSSGKKRQEQKWTCDARERSHRQESLIALLSEQKHLGLSRTAWWPLMEKHCGWQIDHRQRVWKLGGLIGCWRTAAGCYGWLSSQLHLSLHSWAFFENKKFDANCAAS